MGPEMALEGNSGGVGGRRRRRRRMKGIPRERWLDDFQDDDDDDDDVRERWRTKAMDRGEWMIICEATKALREL
jgi:hypothetical protein